jgi:hypothetical protein
MDEDNSKECLKTAHEESYSDGRTLGVLMLVDDRHGEKVNSLIYLFREGMYVFFETIVEMNDYLLYGDNKVKRAYMKEEDFDVFYDNGTEIPFEEHLKWSE